MRDNASQLKTPTPTPTRPVPFPLKPPLRPTLLTPVLFIAAFAVALGGCSAAPAPLSPLKENDAVLAFGDSLTFGTGAPRGQSYPEQLSALIGRKVESSGVPGQQSGAALRRFAAELKRVRPALVIVCIGGNDFLRKVDEAETENNIRAIATIARDQNIPMVLVAVPAASALSFIVPRNHPMFSKVASEYGLWLEDEALKTILSDPSLTSGDFVHPNAAGYLEMAKALAELLRRAGAV